MIHDPIGPRWCKRLLGIVDCWIPNSLENRCHILVQTCLIFCHYLSFRANTLFVVCTIVRRGIATREKMRIKQLRPSFFSTPFSPHYYNGFPSKCQKQNSGIPLIFRPNLSDLIHYVEIDATNLFFYAENSKITPDPYGKGPSSFPPLTKSPDHIERAPYPEQPSPERGRRWEQKRQSPTRPSSRYGRSSSFSEPRYHYFRL